MLCWQEVLKKRKEVCMRDLLCMMRKRRHKHVLLHQCASHYIETHRRHHTLINTLLAVHHHIGAIVHHDIHGCICTARIRAVEGQDCFWNTGLV